MIFYTKTLKIHTQRQRLTFSSIFPSSLVATADVLGAETPVFSGSERLGNGIDLSPVFSLILSPTLRNTDELNLKVPKCFNAFDTSCFLITMGDLKWLSSFFFAVFCRIQSFGGNKHRFFGFCLRWFRLDGFGNIGLSWDNTFRFFMVLLVKLMYETGLFWIIGTLTGVKISWGTPWNNRLLCRNDSFC